MSYGIAPPTFRLPHETRVGVVRLQVSDIDRSVEFYQNIVGLDVLDHKSDCVRLGVASRPLVELCPGAVAGPLSGRRLGLYHFAILLPDRPALGRTLAHLLAAGVKLGASDHLVSEALYIRDPDDLGIEIYHDRARETWALQGRELAMASIALDLEDVMRSGGGEAWQGLPVGTVMGHLHLQVGDLEQGKAFYHVGLGLDLIVWSYPGALFLSGGGYHHHLGINTWAGPSARPAAAQEPKLLEWELVLPDAASVAAAAESLTQQGYVVTTERFDRVAADPWGTQLRLTTVV